MPGRKAPEKDRRKDILRAAYDVAVRQGVEALTVRAVAGRAAVSHGTVLFHFARRDKLIASLLDRVLDATTGLVDPARVASLTTPSERMLALLRAEMVRLSSDPRHYRLFLEYSALGVRNAVIRRRVSEALDNYRDAFRTVSDAVVEDARATSGQRTPPVTSEGLTAVVVSLVHGCALQALIEPKTFGLDQHFDTAARMLDGMFGRERVRSSR